VDENKIEENDAKKIVEKRIIRIREFCGKPNWELLDIFRHGVENYAAGPFGLIETARTMVRYVSKNIGGEFSSPALTNAVKRHDNTKTFINAVKGEIMELLSTKKEYREEIEKLRIKDESTGMVYDKLKSKKVASLRFDKTFDRINGLGIVIHGMWAYQVYITDYVVKNNSFSVELNFIFWDHFGLDHCDLTKFDKDVFYSWFVLQHFKGYRPLITKVSIEKEYCSGKFKLED